MKTKGERDLAIIKLRVPPHIILAGERAEERAKKSNTRLYSIAALSGKSHEKI